MRGHLLRSSAIKTNKSYFKPDCGKEISMMQNKKQEKEKARLHNTSHIFRATNTGKNTTNFPLNILISWLKNDTLVTIVLKTQ